MSASNIPKINFESGGYIVFAALMIIIGFIYFILRTGIAAALVIRYFKHKQHASGVFDNANETKQKADYIINVFHYIEAFFTIMFGVSICNLLIPIAMFDRSSIFIAFVFIPFINLIAYIDAIRLRVPTIIGSDLPLYELVTPIRYCLSLCWKFSEQDQQRSRRYQELVSVNKKFSHNIEAEEINPPTRYGKRDAWDTLLLSVHRYIFGMKIRGLSCLWVWSLSVAYCLIMAFMFQGSCICLEPDLVTTRASRIYATSYCYSSSYCAFYNSLPEKPYEEAILMHYSSNHPISSMVYYDSVTRSELSDYRFKAQCRWLSIPGMEYDGGRFVHTCDLKNLNASTTYHFKFSYTDNHKQSHTLDKEYTFRTFIPPTSKAQDVTFILGGDRASRSSNVEQLYTKAFEKIPKTSVDFIAIGGDLVYANAFPSCYSRYDMLFDELRRHTLDDNNRLIPLLTVLGNHEAYTIGFKNDISLIRNYQYYLTHRIGDHGTSKSSFYHEHHIGQASLMLGLDSHVVNAHVDQNNFIKASFNGALNTDATYQFFGMYHAPLYPSYRAVDGEEAVAGREQWNSIFSQYNVSLAFENHDHLFKRTKPIYNGEVLKDASPLSPHGVVYVGDGSFGVGRTTKTIDEVREERPYLEKIAAEFHVYIVTINSTHNDIRAVNPEGTLVDHFARQRRA